MPNLSATDLPQRIQKLLEERQQHADAIERIDKTLQGISAALGMATNGRNGRRASAATAPPKRGKRRRKVGKFSTTAEESVLGFIKEKKNPTGREIEEHWKGEGRAGAAANALSKLVKDRKLKRTPLEGQRGSRYSLA